jgi:predicted amidophosphoribosyltransferase
MSRPPWDTGRCVKCGAPMIRLDNVPFCSQCEREVTQEASQRIPKLAKKGNIEFRADVETK